MLADPTLREIHPLGKSPIVEIESPATSQPLVLAESGAIVEYLVEHCGKWLIPLRYREGFEGQIGGEREEWLRYRMFMHYAEGSIMPLNVIGLLVQSMDTYPPPTLVLCYAGLLTVRGICM
jgi:glutathione S-transferase